MPLTHEWHPDVEPAAVQLELQPIWAVPKLDVQATCQSELKVHEGFLWLVEADPLVVRGLVTFYRHHWSAVNIIIKQYQLHKWNDCASGGVSITNQISG